MLIGVIATETPLLVTGEGQVQRIRHKLHIPYRGYRTLPSHVCCGITIMISLEILTIASLLSKWEYSISVVAILV